MKCIDDEIPFEIPASWEWRRLGSIIDFSKSNSVKSDSIPDDIWVLDLEDIEKDTGNLLTKKRKVDVEVKSEKHIFFIGNVLYSKLRPYLNKVIIADENGVCTSEILAFDFGLIFNKYAQAFLMSPYFTDYAMSDAYGVKMPRLGSKQGNNALMPIPPINEQYRIIAQIESISPKISIYGQAQSELDQLNITVKDRLKKSILQEAIQGKLVPQDPNDEPASVLLERIRAEKERLIKEKKIKHDKNESVIYKGDDNSYYEKLSDGSISCIDEETPFDIPSSWNWVRLGSIFQHNTGKALNGKGNGTPREYITTSNLYWNSFDFSKVKVMNFSEGELDKCTATKGDLLVCEGGDIGRTAIWNFDYDICIQNHIHKLRPYVFLEIEYFYNVLHLYKGIGKIGGKGIGILGLSSGVLHNILVPCPPVKEQKCIVQKINALTAKL